MGILQSKKRKQKEKHSFNKDIKNGTAKEAATKETTDFKHGKANALAGNLNNTANASPGQGSTHLISHQMEASNGNEAMLTRVYHVPAVDAPQNREQNIQRAVSISQHADPVKYIPYRTFAVRGTQQRTFHAKPKDKKTSTPKPMLQQATTPARPTVGPCCGVKVTAGEFDALRSGTLQELQDVPEKLSQQSRPSAHVQQKTNRRVMDGHTQHEESRHFPPSQQRPAAKGTTEVPQQTARTVAPCDMGMRATADSVQVAAQVLCKVTSRQVECSFGSKEQQEMIPQTSATKMQAPARRTYREVVRGVTAENLHSREAEAQTKAKINKSSSQKSSCANEAGTDLICHATDKAHNTAEQSTAADPGIAEMPPNHSAHVLNQSKAPVNNEDNALQEHCFYHNSVTNKTAVDYLYYVRVKSEISHANAAKMRLRQELAQKLEAQRGDDRNSSQQIAEETVTTVQGRSRQQGCNAMEENTTKKHKEPHHTPQPNGNSSSCVQKVSVKALAQQVPEVEGMPTTGPTNAATHNPKTAAADPGVKLGLRRTLNETGITPAVPPELKARAEGRWRPFTVNQSCPHKVCCQHNPWTDLPQNVLTRSDECPNYPGEPPWVTTARFAACLALRETQEEEGDSHQ